MTLFFDTPILFLIFNRPELSQKVFEQIKAVKPRFLFIAADGPRSDRVDDIVSCKLAREIINQVDWPCELKTLFRNENLGCGLNVSSAISWFFEQVEAGIVLEDDCLPHLSFFPYCEELIKKYKDDHDIYLISGTNVQTGIKRGDASYYFSNITSTWGWASWRRAWNHFNYDISDYQQSVKSGDLDHVFQTSQEKSHWIKCHKHFINRKKDIWDFQWLFAIWRNKGIGITPNTNLIKNIGFRENPVHYFLKDLIREPSIGNPMLFPLTHPEKKIDHEADLFTFKNTFSHSFNRIFRLTKENGLYAILKYSIKRFLEK